MKQLSLLPQTPTRDSVPCDDLLCLSVRQPWAWLIVHGWKNIENRNWPTRVRGSINIHASKGMTEDEYWAALIFVRGFAPQVAEMIPGPDELPRGGIVGRATLLDCVDHHSSEWFVGKWGFVLGDQKRLLFEPCKGALGFFRRHNGRGQ